MPTYRLERRCLCFAVAVVCWLEAAATAQAPDFYGPAKPCAQLVSLRTSDGVRLAGAIYFATKPRPPLGLILVHGYGGNFYGAYLPQLAQAAAEQGITTLALNMRDHDSGPKLSDFTDNQTDIAAGVAYLHSVGVNKVVLLGQSMGTNRVLYYEAASADPSVVATVLVSGPGNLFQWNIWQFGREKAQQSVDEALRMRTAGHDGDLMVVDLGPLGKALYTPRYLLSLRGPEAKSDPYQNIAKLKVPVLILQGKADRLIELDIAERLRKATASNSKVTITYVEGADHGFSQHQSVLVERVLDWIKTAVHD